MNIDYKKILQLLPHRYPFLLIDRVEDIVLGESATGIKNISLGDPVFQGHFPDDPIFPGVLTVEALAQTAGVLALMTLEEQDVSEKNVNSESNSEPGSRPSIYFMTIDKVKFHKPVRPGDVLNLKVVKTQSRANVWRFRGEAYVNNALVSEAEFMAMLKLS